MHGDGVEDGWGDGDAVEQRGFVDGAGVGDGGAWEHDGDVHGHGGDDHERSDGDRYGEFERGYGDGNHRAGDSYGGERADVFTGESGVGREFDVHGDRVEDGRGCGDAVEQRGFVDGAGVGDGGVWEHDGDVHGYGWDDPERSDGDRYGEFERCYSYGKHRASDSYSGERTDVFTGESEIGRAHV